MGDNSCLFHFHFALLLTKLQAPRARLTLIDRGTRRRQRRSVNVVIDHAAVAYIFSFRPSSAVQPESGVFGAGHVSLREPSDKGWAPAVAILVPPKLCLLALMLLTVILCDYFRGCSLCPLQECLPEPVPGSSSCIVRSCDANA
ncbi:hypothetical protein ISCGN_026643 [Ixodes scapularis]